MNPTTSSRHRTVVGSARLACIVAALVGAAAVTVAGCGSAAVSGSARPSDIRASSTLPPSASPADRLEAAVDRTLGAGTMRVTTVANGVTTESQLDYSQRIAYMEAVSGESSPVQSILIRGDDSFVRLAEATDGARANTWYRMPDDGHGSALLESMFDRDFVTGVLMSATTIAVDGTEDVNGSPATRFALTPDKSVVVAPALEALPDEDADEAEREELMSLFADTVNYWVDADGYLVKEDDGLEVKTYRDFGAPLNLPTVDESTVEALPDI